MNAGAGCPTVAPVAAISAHAARDSIPTIAAAPKNVQTGGFGDPNGVAARDTNRNPVNVAQSGSFDLPTGAGSGNGTGGAKGARGVVASAGFGDGSATGNGSGKVTSTRGCNCQINERQFGSLTTLPNLADDESLVWIVHILCFEIIRQARPY